MANTLGFRTASLMMVALAFLCAFAVRSAGASSGPQRRACPPEFEEFLEPGSGAEPEIKLTSRSSDPIPALNQFVAEHHRWPMASRGGLEQTLYNRMTSIVHLGERYLTGLSAESHARLREKKFYQDARDRLARTLAVASPPFAAPLRAKIAVWARLEPYFEAYEPGGRPVPPEQLYNYSGEN